MATGASAAGGGHWAKGEGSADGVFMNDNDNDNDMGDGENEEGDKENTNDQNMYEEESESSYYSSSDSNSNDVAGAAFTVSVPQLYKMGILQQQNNNYLNGIESPRSNTIFEQPQIYNFQQSMNTINIQTSSQQGQGQGQSQSQQQQQQQFQSIYNTLQQPQLMMLPQLPPLPSPSQLQPIQNGSRINTPINMMLSGYNTPNYYVQNSYQPIVNPQSLAIQQMQLNFQQPSLSSLQSLPSQQQPQLQLQQTIISDILYELNETYKNAESSMSVLMSFCSQIYNIGCKLEKMSNSVDNTIKSMNLIGETNTKTDLNSDNDNKHKDWNTLEKLLRKRYVEKPITADIVYTHCFPDDNQIKLWSLHDLSALLYIVFDQDIEYIDTNEPENYMYTQGVIASNLSIKQECILRNAVKNLGEKIGFDSWQLVGKRMGWVEKQIKNNNLETLNNSKDETRKLWEELELDGIRSLLQVLADVNINEQFGVIIGDKLIRNEESKDEPIYKYLGINEKNYSLLKNSDNNILEKINKHPILKKYEYFTESQLGWSEINPEGIISKLLILYKNYTNYRIRAKAAQIAASITKGKLYNMFEVDKYITSQLCSDIAIDDTKEDEMMDLYSIYKNDTDVNINEKRDLSEQSSQNSRKSIVSEKYWSNVVSNYEKSKPSYIVNNEQSDLILWKLIFGCNGNQSQQNELNTTTTTTTTSSSSSSSSSCSNNNIKHMFNYIGGINMPNAKKPPCTLNNRSLIINLSPPLILFALHVVRSLQVEKIFKQKDDIDSIYTDEYKISKLSKKDLNSNICGYYLVQILQSLIEGVNNQNMNKWEWGSEDIIKFNSDNEKFKMWRATINISELKYDLSEILIRLHQCYLLPQSFR